MSGPTVLEEDARELEEFIDLLLTGEGSVRVARRSQIVTDRTRREAYSYGRWFPLFRFVPREGRVPATFVVNGDTWRGGNRGWNRSRTPDHQETVRRLIAASGVRSVIVPFSALDGAGIDIDSVRPIAVREDARWTESHVIPDSVDLANLESADRFSETDNRSSVDYRGEPCPLRGEWFRTYTWRRGPNTYTRTIYRGAHSYRADGSGWLYSDSWDAPVSSHAYMNRHRSLELSASGEWSYTTHHHRLGDAVISAVRPVVLPLRPAAPFESVTDSLMLLADGSDYCRTAPRSEHEAGPSAACIHCGAALVARETVRTRRRYLSSFDANEPVPLYFLAALPRGAARIRGWANV